MFNKIRKFKSSLSYSDQFNIMFRTNGTLLDLIKKTNHRQKPKSISGVDSTCVVYQATCLHCQNLGQSSTYVGETSRALKCRIKEHCRPIYDSNRLDITRTSAIGMHELVHYGSQPNSLSWNFKVLTTERSTQFRKTMESWYINKLKPNLNKNTGVHAIMISKNIA